MEDRNHKNVIETRSTGSTRQATSEARAEVARRAQGPLMRLLPAFLSLPLIASGCAAFGIAPGGSEHHAGEARSHAQVPVRIAGLGFLQLGQSHAAAVAAMERHGYTCYAAASTPRYAPCTSDRGSSPAAVILGLEQEHLLAVEVEIATTTRSPRLTVMDAADSMRRDLKSVVIDESDWGVVVRGLPGDGSMVELRLHAGAGEIQSRHRLDAIGVFTTAVR